MQLKAKLGTAVASAALFASVLVPAASASTTISGNGAGSVNGVNVNTTHVSTTTQSNVSAVTNMISSNANSGNNSSSFNTGGASSVVSGPATSNVTVGVTGGGNAAVMANCNCMPAAPVVNVSGNGAGSFNGVSYNHVMMQGLTQTNFTSVFNAVGSNANSGNNSAMFNTNSGGMVVTNPATSNVQVVVQNPTNTAL